MLSFKKVMNISMKDEMIRDGKGRDLINLEMLEDTRHTSLDYPTLWQNLR